MDFPHRTLPLSPSPTHQRWLPRLSRYFGQIFAALYKCWQCYTNVCSVTQTEKHWPSSALIVLSPSIQCVRWLPSVDCDQGWIQYKAYFLCEWVLSKISFFSNQEKDEEDGLDLLLQQAEALYRQYCFELRPWWLIQIVSSFQDCPYHFPATVPSHAWEVFTSKAQIIHFYAHLFYSKYEMVALSKPGLVLVKLRAYVAFRTIWWISTFIWQWTHKNKICWMKEKKFSPDILSSLRFFLK